MAPMRWARLQRAPIPLIKARIAPACFDSVSQQAESTILFCLHRIGEELLEQPTATGTRGLGRPSLGRARQEPPKSAPSLAEQVGSKKRGERLKKLGSAAKDVIINAAAKLHIRTPDLTDPTKCCNPQPST
jgi:hypothetical protein